MAVHSAKELDKIEDINIYMAINNREPEGPAVLDHTIENFFGRVPLIKDGNKIYENAFQGKEVYDFGSPFGSLLVSTIRPVTSIPLALGAELLAQGKIEKTGVLVPEECLEPKSFINNVIERTKVSNYPITLKKEIIVNTEWN
ncbi:hypothetical protein KQI41_17250 [Tissierella pigra]|uniref:hypothetical protein n=1 Tax=Tissierella pigra TaxID=2607614 RepID=UPI001C0FF34E|nr:hypothetical protein [Tissierella pigra]MBU5428143.1 hypothetical protein [Tissierella pigra]